ncbi:MAG: GH3 auxin-responsive promoter family protein [Clostridia bacterium]|nr:GH3 auxin-responsive promoter family protein [Clostridia bacterium]
MYEVLNNMRKKKVEVRKQLIRHYEALTKEPMAAQEKLLMELMSANKDTEYGKKYSFADISSIEEYQSRVPITEYEDYTGYIDRMVSNSEDNLI